MGSETGAKSGALPARTRFRQETRIETMLAPGISTTESMNVTTSHHKQSLATTSMRES